MPRASPRSKRRSRPTSPRETTPSRCDKTTSCFDKHVRAFVLTIAFLSRPNKWFRPISSDLLLPPPHEHSGDSFFLGFRRNGSRGYGYFHTSDLLAQTVASIQDSTLKSFARVNLSALKRMTSWGYSKKTQNDPNVFTQRIFSFSRPRQHAL